MDWRIEATEATLPADIKAVLEKARDRWVQTEAQLSDPDIALADDLILSTFNEARAKAAAARAKMILDHSKTLDETHSAVVRQMNVGIAAACAIASEMGSTPCRASVVGHYKPGRKDGVYERLSVFVDHAVHG